jgi:hypothetical protein
MQNVRIRTIWHDAVRVRQSRNDLSRRPNDAPFGAIGLTVTSFPPYDAASKKRPVRSVDDVVLLRADQCEGVGCWRDGRRAGLCHRAPSQERRGADEGGTR